jgi:hypothetical protein
MNYREYIFRSLLAYFIVLFLWNLYENYSDLREFNCISNELFYENLKISFLKSIGITFFPIILGYLKVKKNSKTK